jgi:hypothetical protein
VYWDDEALSGVDMLMPASMPNRPSVSICAMRFRVQTLTGMPRSRASSLSASAQQRFTGREISHDFSQARFR